MYSINFDELAIETTRRCNMKCPHCLRGDAQNLDMNEVILESLLSQTSSIGTITFTGGEPSLNTKMIRKTLSLCKAYGINVYSFFIATNGKKITNAFAKVMYDWYLYCLECGGDPICSSISLSTDAYHEKTNLDELEKLKALSFFDEKGKAVSNWKGKLLNIGRARNLNINKTNPVRDYDLEIEHDRITGSLDVRDSTIAITVNGDVLCDCDYEYNNIDDIRICSVDEMELVFKKIAIDPTYNWHDKIHAMPERKAI